MSRLMSRSSHKPSSPYGARDKYGANAKQINRHGYHNLAGDLYRKGPDPVIIQILEEARFLPRNRRKAGGDDEHPRGLKPQPSKIPKAAREKPSDFVLGSLGLGSLRFSPLKLHRVYGRPGHLPVVNVTGILKSHVIYAASNVIVYFDYYKNSQSVLQGHQHKISCLATDSETKFIATGEMVGSPTLIVWNVKTGFPVKRFSGSSIGTLKPIRAVGFLGGGLTYLGLIHETLESKLETFRDKAESTKKFFSQSVSIWFFGEDEQRVHHHTAFHAEEAKANIPRNARRQSTIQFSPDVHHHFVTTGDAHVVFYTWLRRHRKIVCHIPTGHMQFMQRLKKFTATIWVNDSVLTASASGYIVEWKAETPMGLETAQDLHQNVKEFRRFIKIEEHVCLTTLVAYKNFIVVGDDQGSVRFLDNKFRLLRWTRTGFLLSIQSISFNCIDTVPDWKFELRDTYSRAGYNHDTFHRGENSTVCDHTYGGRKYRVPSETTLARNQLHGDEQCLDMVVGYVDGSVAYFHIAEEKVDVILRETLGPDPIVAMDASITTQHIAISTKFGKIQIINYETREVIQSQRIFKKEVEVTSLKIHPSGAFLVIGASNGTIYFRHVFTLSVMDNPLHAGKECIKKMVFSSCGLYLGMFDTDRTVSLCNYNAERGLWGLRGKHRSHYRPIVDIVFFFDETIRRQRFFSLGQDRRVVEYDIARSVATKGLKILTVTALEQTHIPTSMVFDSPFLDHGPILHFATTNNKIRLFDQDELKVRKTCRGPEYGAPVNNMVAISPESNKGRDSKFILMTLGKKIGLIKTPIDGNPFRYMAVLAHPTEIQDVGVGSGGQEIFTRADDDECIFMWIPDVMVLDNCAMAGGLGVEPFKYCLDVGIPPELSVVKDIENIFYYWMMKRATNQHELGQMKLTIPISDIPTVMRTCGYFPSELEIDMLLEEVEFILAVQHGFRQDEISFEDFLILFANHKDSGKHEDAVAQAFQILGDENQYDVIAIPREDFIALMTTKGESLEEIGLPHFLPSFYREVRKLESVNVIDRPWHLRDSSFDYDAPTAGQLLPRSFSNYLQRASNTDSNPDTVEDTQTSSVHSIRSIRTPVPASNTVRSAFVLPEDDFQEIESEPNQEMVAEITVNFFVQNILPNEPYTAFDADRNALADDLADLGRIVEGNANQRSLDDIVKRWKGRDEWKYFKQIFEKLRHDNVSMELRLAAAMEMDLYFETGRKSVEAKTKAEVEIVLEGKASSSLSSTPSHLTVTSKQITTTELSAENAVDQELMENPLRLAEILSSSSDHSILSHLDDDDGGGARRTVNVEATNVRPFGTVGSTVGDTDAHTDVERH